MISNILSKLNSELISLLFSAPVVLVAIICHEYAHGWVSLKLGDPTAKQSGRLTLNPLKHIDPIGAICMLIFHIGWAKPVPINPYYYKNRKKGIILVSIAGPLINFVIAFLSVAINVSLFKWGNHDSVVIWFYNMLSYYSAVVNIGLGLFNLIPIPPLDGSKILGELCPKINAVYYKYGRYIHIALLILIISGILSKPFQILNNVLINMMYFILRIIFRI